MARILIASLALLLLAAPVRAEDPPVAEKAAPALAQVVKAWPAPSAENAFRFEAAMLMGTQRMGSMLIELEPLLEDGAVVGWAAHERMTAELGDKQASGDVRYRFTTDLKRIGGESEDDFQGKETVRWTVADGTVRIVRTKEGGEPAETTVPNEAWQLPGKVGLFMLARFAPAKKVTIEGTSFAGQDDDGAVAPFTLTIDPEARHEGNKVFAVDGTRRNERIQIHADPESREILRVILTKTDSPLKIMMVPPQEAPASDDLFAREARTPQEASAKALYAITMKEKDAIEKAFGWTTMYAHTVKQLEAAGQEIPTLEAWKAGALGRMAAGSPPPGVTPEQIRMGLVAVLEHLEVSDTPEGFKRVTYPEMFRSIVVVLAPSEDGWKAVGLQAGQ